MRLSPIVASRSSAACALLVALVIALTATLPLSAQNALTRPIGGDSIYKLAVDSSAYKEYPFVYLLDDGVVKFEADGRGTQHYHQVVQILKPRGVEAWAERAFSFRPGHTKITVDWMRVLKPSGELISDKPNISQASDIPAAMSNPVYSDTKILRYSLGGVAVGTIVDIAWTDETTDPFLRGDFTTSWTTTMAYPAMRSRFVADLPSSLTPRIFEQHVDFKRVEEVTAGRHYYSWQKGSVMPVKGEAFAPDSSIPRAEITLASSLTWNDVAWWYSGLAKDRYALSPRSSAIVDSVTRNQKTARDTLLALHKWIAKDIRYVSVALGLSGYQPRYPDSTIISGFGDCKDKATLFIAAARRVGLTAYPVLLNSTGVREKTLVSIGQFDHAIAAMPKSGGGYTFLDLTTNAFPPGQVPPNYQGEFGIVVLPNGKADEITFPKDATGSSLTAFTGEANADGQVSGTLEISATGASETGLRLAALEPLDSAQRSGMKKGLSGMFLNSTIDTVIMFDGRDPKAQAKLSVTLHGGEIFKQSGPAAILTVPPAFRGPSVLIGSMLRQLPDDSTRKYPIDASRVLTAGTQTAELRLTIPDGWKAQLPKGVTASGQFGSYRSEYSQEGRVLRIVHTTTGAVGVLPKERYPELKAWLKSIGADAVESIILFPPPTP